MVKLLALTLPVLTLLSKATVAAAQSHPALHKNPSRIEKVTHAELAKRKNWPSPGSSPGCKKIAPGLDDAVIDLIRDNLAGVSTDSWVSGTRAQALLELDAPSQSVYAPVSKPFHPRKEDTTGVLGIAKYWIDQLRPDSQQLAEVKGGAAGDAASLGVAFFLAEHDLKGSEGQEYGKYLKRQKDYLLNVVPRHNATGAISHRPVEEPFQAWNDFVYMVPPFLAQYAVKHHDLSLAREAYKQIQAYRTILLDPETDLWHHIREGWWSDEKLWGTGMAWAVAGIARVYTTLQHSVLRGLLQQELRDLATWANDIIAATISRPHESGLLPNAYKVDNTFGDSASTTLILSAIYRMASLNILENKESVIAKAEEIRQVVYSKIDKESGWISSAVNPLDWEVLTEKSPESMAFLLLLQASTNAYHCGK